MAVNERLNDFVDIQSATEQFDYLTKRIEQYVKQMDEATRVAKISFDALQSGGSANDLNKNATEAAAANKKMAESIKDYSKAVQDTTGYLSMFSGTMKENLKTEYQQQQQLKAIKEELTQLSKVSDNYTVRVAQLKEQELQLKTALSETRMALKQEQKELLAAASSYDEMAIRLGRLRDTYRQLSQAERESEFGRMMVDDIQKLDAEVKKVDASIGNFQRNVGNYPNATAELAAIRQELIKLTLEGKEGTEQFQAMTARATELGTAISSVGKITSTTGGAVTVTSGAFQKATNAAHNFQQVLRETPAAAYSAGTYISAISNNLPMLIDSIKQLNAANKEARAIGERTVPVWKTLATSLFSFNGIATLAISALTILAMKTDIFKNKTVEAADAAKKLADEMRNIDKAATASASSELSKIDVLTQVIKNANLAMDVRIRAVEELQKMYPDYLGNLTKEKMLTGEVTTEMESLNKAIIARSLMAAVGNKITKEFERQVAAEVELSKLRRQQFDQQLGRTQGGVYTYGAGQRIERLTAEIANAQSNIDMYNKLIDEYAVTAGKLAVTSNKVNNVNQIGLLNSIFEAEKRNHEARLKYDLQQLQLAQEKNKAIMQDEAQSLATRLQAQQEYQAAVMGEAQLTNATEIAITKEKLKQLDEMQRRYNDGTLKLNKTQLKVLALDKETYNLQLQAQEQMLQTSITEIIAKGIIQRQGIIDNDAANRAAKTKAFITKELLQLEDRIADIEDQYARESVIVSQSYLNKEISQKEFNRRMRELRIKYADTELLARIEEDRYLLRQDEIQGQERLKIQRRLNKELQQLNDNRVAAAQQQQNNPFGLTDEEMQRFNQFSAQAIEAARSLADLSNQFHERKINALEKERQLTASNYDAEIASIQKSMLSEEAKEKKIAGIKAAAAIADKANLQQQNALKRKQAINDKAAAAAAVIQQTSVAILSALKIPPPFGQILAAAIGVTGGLQLAKVLATEIPAYAEGTPEGGHPETGYALVGEEYKPELILDGGAARVVSSPTITKLGKGARVIPQDKITEDIGNMINFLSPSILRQLAISGMDSGGSAISLDRLEQTFVSESKATREAIKNKQETHFSWSNGELQKSVKNGNNWTTYIHRQNS
jgi:hypothetical protein